MAFQSIWYTTRVPKKLVDTLEESLSEYDSNFSAGITYSGINLKSRDSKTCWIPSDHWICGFCYHHVLMSNRTNFNYDIFGFDHDQMQYTSYSEGEYYNWHLDGGITVNSDVQRKLSVVLQLSDPDEYEGGEMQIMNEDGSMYILPKTRGTLIVFDSRARHRVRKVYSGERKSLVGWVVGPRWK